ncbi:MAG: DUF3795 domain-containing protein [Promethearchaeia archaeon]
MKPNDEIQMSPCGLFCNKCSLFLVPYDKKAANEVLMWFKNENWYENDQKVEELIQNEDYCEGCRSSRERLHWSSNCQILNCCVDKKELEFCNECKEFPCEIYKDWVRESEMHQKTFEALQKMNQK